MIATAQAPDQQIQCSIRSALMSVDGQAGTEINAKYSIISNELRTDVGIRMLLYGLCSIAYLTRHGIVTLIASRELSPLREIHCEEGSDAGMIRWLVYTAAR